MIHKPRSLIDELYLVEGKAEIVYGEIVRMSPAGIRHGRGAGTIYRSLAQHEEKVGGGYAFPDNVGFIVDLPNRQSFSPDAAWVARDLDENDPAFVDGPPTFAVEVRSSGDYGPSAEKAIRQKIADYFAAGALVVWDVDPLSDDVIKCFRSTDPDQPQLFGRGDKADAEPAVPGWRFPVRRLFPS